MGELVTKEVIRTWYNPSKKGIIIVGAPRCGSNFLARAIAETLAANGVDALCLGEFAGGSNDQVMTMAQGSTQIESLFPTDRYHITTMVTPLPVNLFFGNATAAEIVNKFYTVILLKRRDIPRQIMSGHIQSILHQRPGTWHSGLTKESKQLVEFASKDNVLSLKNIARYSLIFTLLSHVKYTFAVEYENISVSVTPDASGFLMQNEYPYTPSQFFSNYTQMEQYILAIKAMSDQL